MKCTFSITAALLLSSAAVFAQYTNRLEDGAEQEVTNVWSTTDVWVGNTTSSNTLLVAAGGDIDSADVFVGVSPGVSDNTISMTGASRWDIAGQLVIGEGTENSVSVADGSTLAARGLTLYSGNELSVVNGGSIEGLISMSVYSNTTISGDGIIGFGTNDATLAFYGTDIGLAAGVVFSADAGYANTLAFNNGELDVSGFNPAQYENFGSLRLVNSGLTGAGSMDTFSSIEMTGGFIDPSGPDSDTARLEIGGLFSATGGTVYSAQIYEARHDELVFTGPDDVDLSNMAADVLVVSAPLGTVTIMSNSAGNLTGTFSRVDLEDRLLLYNAVLQVTSNEVKVALEADPPESVMEFAAMEMVRAGFGGMQNAVFTRTKQLRRNLVATAHTILYETPLL
ncbi:MAG TPA: hypothetical protein VLL07_00220, partial [Pontiella sp.]|nr:hypothetical protein [Pontiella sp.]